MTRQTRARIERLERAVEPVEADRPAATFYIPDNGRGDVATPPAGVVLYNVHGVAPSAWGGVPRRTTEGSEATK